MPHSSHQLASRATYSEMGSQQSQDYMPLAKAAGDLRHLLASPSALSVFGGISRSSAGVVSVWQAGTSSSRCRSQSFRGQAAPPLVICFVFLMISNLARDGCHFISCCWPALLLVRFCWCPAPVPCWQGILHCDQTPLRAQTIAGSPFGGWSICSAVGQTEIMNTATAPALSPACTSYLFTVSSSTMVDPFGCLTAMGRSVC